MKTVVVFVETGLFLALKRANSCNMSKIGESGKEDRRLTIPLSICSLFSFSAGLLEAEAPTIS